MSQLNNILLVSDSNQQTQSLVAELPSHATTNKIDWKSDELTKAIRSEAFDFIILLIGHLTQDDLPAIQLIVQHQSSPILVFAEQDPFGLAASATRVGVTSFVVDGLEGSRLSSLIEVARERNKFHLALQDELRKSQEQLAARKSIERAKGILMESKGLSEQDAYRSLREKAMQQGKTLTEIAETVVSMSDLFR